MPWPSVLMLNPRIAGLSQTGRDRFTRALFGTASRLGGSTHAILCSLYFGLKYRTADPWGYQTKRYEVEKYVRTLASTEGRRYDRALEVGCGEGAFTRTLADRGHVTEIVGMDISQRALGRARAGCQSHPNVSFTHGDVFRSLPLGRFDLIICSEILYYAGDRRSVIAERLSDATTSGGRLVLVHPWPESITLHASFGELPGTRLVDEVIHRDNARPYAISIYEQR